MTRGSLRLVFIVAAAVLSVRPALAQAPLPAPAAPSYAPPELDRIVSPIALYPDPLLAQVLAAATYPTDIPAAAQWANEHRSFTGDRLTAAIATDEVPWDPSVQAPLPFPSVLDMMSRDMAWTEELGHAVLADRTAVMDAVQRLRHEARTYGYLRPNTAVTVTDGPYIEILPVDVGYIPVPYYEPLVVFRAPRPGIVVAAAISYRFGVTLGAAFAPWGWGTSRFAWPEHLLIINRVPWTRTFANRAAYVHPYAVPRYVRHDVPAHAAREHGGPVHSRRHR